MRCKAAQRSLSARSDGELADDRREPLERHLADCDACRVFASDLVAGAARLDLFSAPPESIGFRHRVMAGLPAQHPRLPSLGTLLDFLRPAPLGLSAAAFSLGAFLTLVISDQARTVAADVTQTPTIMSEESLDSFAVLAELTNEESFVDLLTDDEEQ